MLFLVIAGASAFVAHAGATPAPMVVALTFDDTIVTTPAGTVASPGASTVT